MTTESYPPQCSEVRSAEHRGVDPHGNTSAFASINEWHKVRLGDILEEVDVRVRDLDETEPDPPVLSLTKDNGLVLQSERFGKRIATEDVSKYKVVREGWITHNPYVLWEGAIHALWGRPVGIVSPVYPVWQVVNADERFVDYLLKTPPLLAEYMRLASGVVQRRRSIAKATFLDIEVCIPPLREQRAIAHVLRTVQQAREATEQVIEATRELKRSLMRHLFTYGPVPVDEADQVPLKETEIGPVPEHWSVCSLGSLISEGPQNGLYKPQSEYGSGTPIIRIDDYDNQGSVVTNAGNRVRLSRSEIGKYGLNAGDILVNRVNSLSHLGKTALVGQLSEAIVFESNMMRFAVDNEKVSAEYVFRFLSSPPSRNRLRSSAKRAVAQSSVNQGDIKSIPVPLAPRREMGSMTDALLAVDRKIFVEERRLATIGEVFDSLLHHLMTGKVRVPIAEGAAEAKEVTA
jgi:type I restriction enzyme, S subunit